MSKTSSVRHKHMNKETKLFTKFVDLLNEI